MGTTAPTAATSDWVEAYNGLLHLPVVGVPPYDPLRADQVEIARARLPELLEQVTNRILTELAAPRPAEEIKDPVFPQVPHQYPPVLQRPGSFFNSVREAPADSFKYPQYQKIHEMKPSEKRAFYSAFLGFSRGRHQPADEFHKLPQEIRELLRSSLPSTHGEVPVIMVDLTTADLSWLMSLKSRRDLED